MTNNKNIKNFIIPVIWINTIIHGFIIIAVRNHYTVDLTIALYTCILLWHVFEKYFPNDLQLDHEVIRQSNSESDIELVELP